MLNNFNLVMVAHSQLYPLIIAAIIRVHLTTHAQILCEGMSFGSKEFKIILLKVKTQNTFLGQIFYHKFSSLNSTCEHFFLIGGNKFPKRKCLMVMLTDFLTTRTQMFLSQ